jgi:hypothetical protein
MARPIYVEAVIDADPARLWSATQDPDVHQRWDARFGEITYLPLAELPDGGPAPKRFRYATRVLPGLTIAGTGISVGERVRADGTATSALRFASDHPLSLIRAGAGYWRYVPTPGGIRFLTRYDYTPGWGFVGPLADRAFRPFFGWLTAWSFDRLRLWLERGIAPRRALHLALIEFAGRVAVGVAMAVLTGDVLLTLLVVAAVGLIPPLPCTPAARRCRRRPSDRRAATAPATLAPLEQP